MPGVGASKQFGRGGSMISSTLKWITDMKESAEQLRKSAADAEIFASIAAKEDNPKNHVDRMCEKISACRRKLDKVLELLTTEDL